MPVSTYQLSTLITVKVTVVLIELPGPLLLAVLKVTCEAKVPAVVGVPVTKPVSGAMLRPAGNPLAE